MARPVRIGNAHGFWGDRLEAAAEMLAAEPDLDFLTLDFLAEVSMSILALQRSRDPNAGWPRDFVEIVRTIAPYWRSGGHCRLITNAGGLAPMRCASACYQALQEAGCTGRTIAVISGDDVLDIIRRADADQELLRNMDTGRSMADVKDRLLTANAYLGAQPIAAALDRGADLVITGRVADPSLTVAACAHWFGWQWDDWDHLAGATVAGHLIECGTQLTGGIATDWLDAPDIQRIGFPIVEVDAEGNCIATKPSGSGGWVCQQTVKEQLLYEIADPDAYLSPDVTASIVSLRLANDGENRVRVCGARGRPVPPTYKVSATYQDGFRAQGELTIFGTDAVAKARRAGQAVLARLTACGVSFRQAMVECLGAGACRPPGADLATSSQLTETVLRIAVADDSREAVERFSRELMPLVTAGPPGTTGYAEGRPRVHPLYRFWPCLIQRYRVTPQIELLSLPGEFPSGRPERAADNFAAKDQKPDWSACKKSCHCQPRRLGDIAYARSGDKGIHANIGVIARHSEDFPRLQKEVTAQRVASHLGLADIRRVTRYELPNLGALNFVVHSVLSNALCVDAQGKTLGQVLLEMPLQEAE